MTDSIIREAVGVFHGETLLRDAADELMISGFDRSHLSIVAGHRTIEQKLGHMYDRATDIEDDPDIPRLAYIGTDSRTEAKGLVAGGLGYVGAVAAAGAVVASGGTVGAAMIGAAIAGGTGGVVGAVLARLIGRHHAHYLQEQLDRGGILLWVRTADDEHEKRAVDILTEHAADDVHIHQFAKTDTEYQGGVSYDMSFMKRLGM